MGRFETAEALVRFHIEDQRKDALINRLEGHLAAFKATTESLSTENASLRRQITELENNLHDKWMRNEVLSSLFSRIAMNIAEAEDALRGNDTETNVAQRG